jgi:hypothetical protein
MPVFPSNSLVSRSITSFFLRKIAS